MRATPAPMTRPGCRTANRTMPLSTFAREARSLRYLIAHPHARLELLRKQHLCAAHHHGVARHQLVAGRHQPATGDGVRARHTHAFVLPGPTAAEHPDE